MPNTYHLLKVDTDTISPAAPESHWLFEAHANSNDPQVGVVLRRESGRLIYVTGFGSADPLGSQHYAVADQSGRSLGWMTVVGSHDHSTGEKRGEVPARKMPYYVFK